MSEPSKIEQIKDGISCHYSYKCSIYPKKCQECVHNSERYHDHFRKAERT